MERTKKISVVLLALCLIISFAAGCLPAPPDLSDRDGRGYSQNEHDYMMKVYKVSPADDYSDSDGTLAWWDEYPRFAGEGSVDATNNINADTTFTGSRNDEGRGPYARQIDFVTSANSVKEFHEAGIKVGSWIECQGEARAFMLALHQNEDGSFETDPKTGAARLLAWVWNYTSASGPIRNHSYANYICWCGVHSFVNNEEWAYPYILSEYPEMSTPTYPDGTPAVGYFDGGDVTTPQLAKFYDACASKNLYGEFMRYNEISLTLKDNTLAPVFTDRYGKTYVGDDLNFGKDTAAPFWLEYEKNSIDFWVSKGVDFFWIDNWNGWDNISNTPQGIAFGDWSEYKFKEFLKEHPEFGVEDPDSFEITDHIKRSWEDSWTSEKWLSDPIWMAYLSFKVQTNRDFNKEVFTAVKDASEHYTGDREHVAVTVNDFPYLSFGAFDCDYIDLISTEYNGLYLASTHFVATGFPPNRYSGHCYSLLTASARSHNAVIWYYATSYPYTDISGRVFGYEALAYNTLMHSSFSGTPDSNREVNGNIGKLKETFSDRKLYSEIGIVYSPDSEMSYMAPGGFVGPNPTDISFMGWGQALDELNVPYKSIQMQKLAETIDSCSIIILPCVRSIDEATVNDVIKPWMDKGGLLVVTGRDAGLCDSMEGLYAMRSEPYLKKFAQTYAGKGKAIYLEEDPCYDYFIANKNGSIDDMYDEYLADIEKTVDEWFRKGYTNRLLTLEGIDVKDSIVTTLNYSAHTKTFFLDVVNMQYDPEENVLSPFPEDVRLTVRIPSNYWGYEDLDVSVFSDTEGEIRTLEKDKDYTIDGIYITLNMQDANIYATFMIAGK